jgi:dipeptidyl aminopeptidase/acylaminoacyl peptidase
VARLALAALGLAAVLFGSAGAAAKLSRPGKVIFSVFAGLPAFQGDERCEGLYAVNADGSGLARLTGYASGRSAFYPGFSADGRTLSFGVPESGLRRAPLYTLDTASGRFRKRSRFFTPFGVWPAWSPRGRSLLFSYQRGRKLELHSLTLPSGRERNLTPGVTALGGSWSPDARQIAFSTLERPRRRSAVFIMSSDGTQKRLLARDAAMPSWSPRGERIAFFRPASLASSLWLGNVSGSLRKLAERARPPAVWSPRGDALMFLREPRVASSPGSELGAGDLYRRDLGSGRERLVERNVIPLAWQRDGRILFLRGRAVSGEGVFAVVVARADGTRERVVAVTDEEDVNIGSLPAWQPVRAPLAAAAAPFAPRADGGRCLRLLRRLRSRLAG